MRRKSKTPRAKLKKIMVKTIRLLLIPLFLGGWLFYLVFFDSEAELDWKEWLDA